MSVEKSLFGTLNDGTEIYLYTIKNKNGSIVKLQTLGAGIQSILVPDKNGKLGDVVLGFDDPNDYLDPDNGYQGLVVGRWANRIRGAKFTFEGKEYTTPMNGLAWTLHSGGHFSFTPWDVDNVSDNSVTFKRFSPDLEDGFPGDFTIKVKYTFTDDDTLRIDYSVLSDRNTVANVTNHSYFNLSNSKSDTVENHYLKINAKYFTKTDESQLPTGELMDLTGTMMDFQNMHKIGDRIDEPFSDIIDGIGYDNNYCVNDKVGEFKEACVLEERQSGRRLSVYTDLPGMQLYCGGWLAKDNMPGKDGSYVTYRRGAALETQFYPDSLHFPNFPVKYVKANEEFTTTTEFRFSVIE